ncbi:MAG: RluA family pseudouridine synthase [Acidobacteriia bacterium]|nr:RluA family pseudouridine synthase [Terriglobia bacterium]
MGREMLVAGPDDAGKSVQQLLHDRLRVPHSRARGLILAGGVRRNGEVVSSPGARVSRGDRIEATADAATARTAPRRAHRAHGYRIVHEERDFVVVDKEAGLITVPSPSHRGESLIEMLTDLYRKRGFRHPAVHAVHRIDRFTSGLVVAARPGPAFAALRAQFASGRPDRVYLAVAEGRFERDLGRLEHRLAEHPVSLKVHPVPLERAGRKAVSRFRVLERFSGATLLEVRLETGRRNQIRVQLAAEGHPLLGDVAYGRRSTLIGRTALHAHRLAFDHPTGGPRLAFDAPPPADFRRLLTALRRGGEH